MIWLSNLKMRSKVLGGFVIVLAMMAGLGVLAMTSLSKVEAVTREINGNALPGIIALTEIRGMLKEHRLNLVSTLAARDEQAILAHERTAAELQGKVEAAFRDYQRFLVDDVERGLYDAAGKSLGVYMAGQLQVVGHLQKKEMDQARDLLLGAQAERRVDLGKRIDDLVLFNVKHSEMLTQQSSAIQTSSQSWVVGALALAILSGLVFAFLLSQRITEPLLRMIAVLSRATTGDLTARIAVSGKDEVGEAGAMMNSFLESLHETMSQVAMTSAQVASASEQLSASSEQLASGTQQQAAAVEETAASLEEMTGAVKQNAENASAASALASGSKSGGDAASATSAMAEISHASKKIGEIIGVIDEIAFQTNLLALNAAVEAARAGDQGRGFAVVAAEVRILAQRSATAAKEIKLLISDSLHKVEDGSALVKRVTDFMAEIASANLEQASGIGELDKAIAQMDQVVQSNSSQTDELSSTAAALSSQAEQLRAMVDRFQLDGSSAPVGASAPPASQAISMTRLAQRPRSAKRPRPARPLHAAVPAPRTSNEFPGAQVFEHF